MVRTDFFQSRKRHNSFKRDEPGRVCGTDTGPTVLHWLVGDRELCKVMANHLRLNLNLVEGLAIVDTDKAANHLRDNDHVAEMCPHWLRLLTSRSILFRLAQLLDERHGLPLETPLEPSAGASGEHLDKVVGGHVEEGIEIHAAIAELAERPLLRLRAGGHLRVNVDVRHGRVGFERVRSGGGGEEWEAAASRVLKNGL